MVCTRVPRRLALRALAGVMLMAALVCGVRSISGAAPGRVHGRVVALRAGNVVLVRHAAMSGMPAMTMAFQVRPSAWALLRPGAAIDGGVNPHSEPWSLDDVHVGPPAAGRPAAYIPPLHEGDALPNFSLVDQAGRPVTLRQFGGTALIVSFIYTRCPDPHMCPLVSAKFERLQRALAHERVHLLEVTLDPRYDTPPVLARYAARFSADPRRWTIATGNAGDIADLGSRVGIASTLAAGGNLHSEAVVVVDGAGRVVRIIDGNDWTVEQVGSEARTALGAHPSAVGRLTLWLAAGVAAACGGGRSGFSTGASIVLFIVVLAAAGMLIKRVFRALFV